MDGTPPGLGPDPERLVWPDELAGYLRIEQRTLKNWRALGRGPRVTRVGNRVCYRVRHVHEWTATLAEDAAAAPLGAAS